MQSVTRHVLTTWGGRWGGGGPELSHRRGRLLFVSARTFCDKVSKNTSDSSSSSTSNTSSSKNSSSNTSSSSSSSSNTSSSSSSSSNTSLTESSSDITSSGRTVSVSRESSGSPDMKEVKAMIERNSREGERRLNLDQEKRLIFTDEEKAVMRNVEQRIPYMVEKEPGKFMYENTVRPLIHFPDTTMKYLELHEEVKEYTLGFPVVRPPHIQDRIKEAFRLTKSTPEEYPWIQNFKHQYDILIIGGGIVGSCIANFLAERIQVEQGYTIAVVEKDPTHRHCLSTQMLGGLRNQFSLAENVDLSLFASDFIRRAEHNLTVPLNSEDEELFYNIPKLKYQPHGNLTLATEEQMADLEEAHEVQRLLGAQTALLTKAGLEKRFPWLNTAGLAGGCLGLESEGWFDAWNLLQSLQIRNKYLGVEYIHGEVMYFKRHLLSGMTDESNCRNYEAHMFLPNTKTVYPIEFSKAVIAAGAQSGNVGRMAGIGTGRGAMYMDIPVEPRRGYIFELKCPDGPGLNFPLISDPSGLFMRRDGHLNHYLVGKLPGEDMEEKIPTNLFGDVDPQYFEEEILPLIQHRIPGFSNYTLLGSRAVDYDYNYIDQSPVVGMHPVSGNVFMACGFNGRGAQFGPGVGRAMMELMLDDGYVTVDLSRFSFDRFLTKAETREKLYV